MIVIYAVRHEKSPPLMVLALVISLISSKIAVQNYFHLGILSRLCSFIYLQSIFTHKSFKTNIKYLKIRGRRHIATAPSLATTGSAKGPYYFSVIFFSRGFG